MSVFEMKSRELQDNLNRLGQIHSQSIKQSGVVITSLEREKAQLKKKLEESQALNREYQGTIGELDIWKKCCGVMSIFFMVFLVYNLVEMIL